jgi:hypothetical protein
MKVRRGQLRLVAIPQENGWELAPVAMAKHCGVFLSVGLSTVPNRKLRSAKNAEAFRLNENQ